MKSKFLGAWTFIICLAFTTVSYAQIAAHDTTIIIKVSGVYCPQCPPNICARVKKETGVKDCILIGKPSAVSKFEVTYNYKVITYNKVIEAVQSTPSCDDPDEKPFKVKTNK